MAGQSTDKDLVAKTDHVKANFWVKLRGAFSRLPFAEDLVAAYYCAMDPATPTRVRATLLGALAYFILPIDAIPDVIVGLGYSDDAAVLAMAISMVSSHISPAHRAAAQKVIKDGIDAAPDV